MTRFAFWAVIGLAVLIDAFGHDGYHFIAIAALAFAVERREVA